MWHHAGFLRSIRRSLPTWNQWYRRASRKMDDPEIKATVFRGLAQYWSPEQIAGHLKLDVSDKRRTVSARTIYTWIARDKDCQRWCYFLRHRGRRGLRPKRPPGIGATIRERPKVIEARSRLGDFEGDTVLGPGIGGHRSSDACGSQVTLYDHLTPKGPTFSP